MRDTVGGCHLYRILDRDEQCGIVSVTATDFGAAAHFTD